MITVAQVVHDFLPKHPYGTENYTYHLSKELQETSNVYIFCREDKDSFGKDFSRDEVFDGLPVRRLYFNPSLVFNASYRNPFVDEEFESFLDEIKPDIVHFQHLMGLSASMIQVAKQRRIPTILTLNDFWFLCPQVQLLTNDNQVCSGPDLKDKCANCTKILHIYGKLQTPESFPNTVVKFLKYPPEPLRTMKKLIPSGLKNVLKEKLFSKKINPASIIPQMIEERLRFLRKILDKVDVIIAPSEFLKKKFTEYGVVKNKIMRSGYGINHKFYNNFSKQPSNKFRFGFVGNVSEHKGIKVLIRAFNKIKRDNVSLSIFGPYEQSFLSKLRKELKIDSKITFYGPFDNRETSSIFSKIDVLVYPSIWYENQPIAILEALVARIPVITSNLGGMAELVQDGVTGLLFEAGNSDDLHRKMVSLVESPELLTRLSVSFRRVKTIGENAKEMDGIYRSLLQKGARNKLGVRLSSCSDS